MVAVADGAVCTGSGGAASCTTSTSCCIAMKVNIDSIPTKTNVCMDKTTLLNGPHSCTGTCLTDNTNALGGGSTAITVYASVACGGWSANASGLVGTVSIWVASMAVMLN